MNAHPVAGYLALTLYVGAAINDADLAQKKRLQNEIKPHLDQLRTAEEKKMVRNAVLGVFETIQEVMGPDWKPASAHWQFIQRLLRSLTA